LSCEFAHHMMAYEAGRACNEDFHGLSLTYSGEFRNWRRGRALSIGCVEWK